MSEYDEYIKITSDTLVHYELTLESLKKRFDHLSELTKEYPLECEFKNIPLRVMFENSEQIKDLISALERKISEFKNA